MFQTKPDASQNRSDYGQLTIKRSESPPPIQTEATTDVNDKEVKSVQQSVQLPIISGYSTKPSSALKNHGSFAGAARVKNNSTFNLGASSKSRASINTLKHNQQQSCTS